jgi:hypothetical protein
VKHWTFDVETVTDGKVVKTTRRTVTTSGSWWSHWGLTRDPNTEENAFEKLHLPSSEMNARTYQRARLVEAEETESKRGSQRRGETKREALKRRGIDPGKVQLSLCVRAMLRRGHEQTGEMPSRAAVSRAFAVCTASLQDKGYLRSGSSEPTKKGLARSQQMLAERADVITELDEYESFLQSARSSRASPARSRAASSRNSRTRGAVSLDAVDRLLGK